MVRTQKEVFVKTFICVIVQEVFPIFHVYFDQREVFSLFCLEVTKYIDIILPLIMFSQTFNF